MKSDDNRLRGRMRIAVVSTFYSANMGYTENCLPAALARRGHDVHLIASRLNVYGNAPDYDRNYGHFLGDRECPEGVTEVNGFTLHRLDYRLIGGYVAPRGLRGVIRRLAPDIVHSTAVASFASYAIATMTPRRRFLFYTECHQHLSVMKPFLVSSEAHALQRGLYWLTRTLPGAVVGRATKRCYAIAPDCAEVAERYYGVPRAKIRVQPIGTDTTLFHKATTTAELTAREFARREAGFPSGALVCVYTGRLTPAKNPLVLAQAVDQLAERGLPVHGMFVGDGIQREAIESLRNCTVRPFVPHADLPDVYRMADIAVWPRQESMSMLDAAASELPIVVSASIGDHGRIRNNGAFYQEDNVEDLSRVIEGLFDDERRSTLGRAGRQLMCETFSWDVIARTLEEEYMRDEAQRNGQ